MQVFQYSLKEKLLPLLILLFVLLFLGASLQLSTKSKSSDVMRSERVELIVHSSIPQLKKVANNALIDKTIRFSDGVIAIEGWTTWEINSNKTLHVHSAPGVTDMRAYAYERSDLEGRTGAKGFFLVVKNSQTKDLDICVMNMIGLDFYSISGSAC
jgi:hypothetical protein